MSVYYNDNDPFCAAWLRAAIAAGHLPAGDVDERDIQQVQASDLRNYTQCHFFAGIGGWAVALQLAGWTDRPVWTGSCPCQPFSTAGKGKGEADPRHLWPEWFRLIQECRPQRIFGEQVEGAINHGWLDLVSADLEAEGYAVGAVVLGAHSVGAPHRRQRLWFVADASHGWGPREARTQRFERDGDLGGLGNAEGRDWSLSAQTRQEDFELAGASAPGSVGHTGGSGRQGRNERRDGTDQRPVGQASMGNGTVGAPESGGATAAEQQGRLRSPESTGENFWSDCDWLPCRDGKARPAISSAQLVAHGIPPELAVLCPKGAFPNRAAILRAVGNAIVPQVAARFIQTAIASLAD